jgi:hypothetical protein
MTDIQSVVEDGRYFLHEYVQRRVGALPDKRTPAAAEA